MGDTLGLKIFTTYHNHPSGIVVKGTMCVFFIKDLAMDAFDVNAAS
jgi:hypothetical protein